MRTGWLLAILLGAALCGCAAERSGTALPMESVANPPSGAAVRLTVRDKRTFAAHFEKASAPFLDAAADGDIRRRVFGRDPIDGRPLLLATDTGVTQVASKVLANALKASGYRVVTPGDPDFATATPLTAVLDTFWAWTVAVPPDPVMLHYYECDIDLRLVGDWPLADYGERQVRGSEWMFETDASAANWRAILAECLSEIDYVVKFTVKKSGKKAGNS